MSQHLQGRLATSRIALPALLREFRRVPERTHCSACYAPLPIALRQGATLYQLVPCAECSTESTPQPRSMP